MPVMSFDGSIQSTFQGVGSADYGSKPYTMIEFSPIGDKVFQLKADGHLDLAKYLRQDMHWELQVSIRQYGRNTSVTVLNVSGSSIKSAK